LHKHLHIDILQYKKFAYKRINLIFVVETMTYLTFCQLTLIIKEATMKTNQFIRTTLFFILFGLFGTFSFAKTHNNLIYDTEEVNGVMISQTVYKQDDGILAKYQKYTYEYDDNHRITRNTSYKWSNGTWTKDMCIRHEYIDNSIKTTYYKWDNDKKEYILQPNMTLITENN